MNYLVGSESVSQSKTSFPDFLYWIWHWFFISEKIEKSINLRASFHRFFQVFSVWLAIINYVPLNFTFLYSLILDLDNSLLLNFRNLLLLFLLIIRNITLSKFLENIPPVSCLCSSSCLSTFSKCVVMCVFF